MPPPPIGRYATPKRRGTWLAGWLFAALLTLRAAVLAAPVLGLFVALTALAAGGVEEPRLRLGIGVLGCVAVPLLLRWRVAAALGRTRFAAPGAAAFVAAVDLCALAILGLGFADDMGRALRRHGDWFVGERNGLVARRFRRAVAASAGYLERYDPPAELASITLPPDPVDVPAGPWRPGEEPTVAPRLVAWFHPLAGPRRALPWHESRRFGAARPQPRPSECELGHCGVDLGDTFGEPVFASFDGVVEKIERDAERGGRAGRYLRIGHKNGTVVTRYIHLDSIRDGLKEGDTVRGGELVGRLGRTGVFNSGPHLHFGLSLRAGGRNGDERYIDPEPLLRTWQLPDARPALEAATARR